jgi:hypothetical protein
VNCRAARTLVAKLIENARAALPDLRFEEVDITEHPEVAVKYRVMATPAIAINGKLEFVGVPPEGILLDRLRRAVDK